MSDKEPRPLNPAKDALRASILSDWKAATGGKAAATPAPEPEPDEAEAEDEDTGAEREGIDLGEDDADPDDEAGDEPADEPAAEAESPADEAEEEPAKPEAEAPPKKVAQGLAALAKRDAESRRAHQTRMAEIQQAEQGLKAREQQMRAQIESDVHGNVRRAALEDPVGFYKKLGVTKGYQELGAQFYYADLGKDAPPDVQEKAKFYGIQQKVGDVEQKLTHGFQQLAQERQQLAQERMVTEYRQGLMADVPALKATPYFTALHKANPKEAGDYMIAAATDYMRTNPGAPPPNAATLAEVIEQAIRQRVKPFEALSKKKPTPAADDEDEPATTLSANHSDRTSPRKAPTSRDARRKEVLRDWKKAGR